MWTATAMGREANCSYNQCFAFELRGPLRVESLRVALDGVVRRHEALRTVIAPDGASQTVQPPFAVELPLVDVSELGSDERGHELERLLDLECETPFDLATDRCCARSSCERVRMRIGSCSRPTTSCATAGPPPCSSPTWAACTKRTASGFPRSSIRPPRTASTSRPRRATTHAPPRRRTRSTGLRSSTRARRSSTYPCARGLPSKTYRSGREELRIDAELYAALKKTGARSGATLFATLVAAYDVLLSRLSGQTRPRRRHPLRGSTQARQPRPRRALRQHGSASSARRAGRVLRRPPQTRRRRPRRGAGARARHVRESRAQVAARAGPCPYATRRDHVRDRSDRRAVRLRRRRDRVGPRRRARISNFEIQVNASTAARISFSSGTTTPTSSRSRRPAVGSRTTRHSSARSSRDPTRRSAPFPSSPRRSASRSCSAPGRVSAQVEGTLHEPLLRAGTSDPRRDRPHLW